MSCTYFRFTCQRDLLFPFIVSSQLGQLRLLHRSSQPVAALPRSPLLRWLLGSLRSHHNSSLRITTSTTATIDRRSHRIAVAITIAATVVRLLQQRPHDHLLQHLGRHSKQHAVARSIVPFQHRSLIVAVHNSSRSRRCSPSELMRYHQQHQRSPIHLPASVASIAAPRSHSLPDHVPSLVR